MNIKSSLLARATKSLLVLSTIALSMSMSSAHAAKFGVRVVDDNGQPMSGVSVCIGLQGNYKQFGATFTDARGQVMVDVPNVPLLVTVSKDRFSGVRTTEPARSFNLIKEVKLTTGVVGPRCRAGSVLTDAGPGIPNIVVTDIAIFAGEGSTTLSPRVSGEPNQYRLSGDEMFGDATWKDYTNNIVVAGGLADASEVYLQMRKVRGNSRAFLETRSEVLTVRLN